MQKVIKTNPVYSPYYKDQSRLLVIHGGAGSGKSVFISAKILRRVCEETPHKILVIRKVASTLKDSVYAEISERIDEFGIRKHVHPNKTEKTFTLDNGNVILCKGLDEPEKIKSIEGITSVWIEEATELNEDDFDQLILRVRGEKSNYIQFILSFNPIDENHWIKKRLIDTGEATVLHTTYKDNVFLDDDYIQTLNNLQHTNSLFYQIYCLGEWGIVDTSNKFLYAFDQSKHVVKCDINEDLPIKLSFDFNLEPFAVSVYQTPDNDTINFIDKIRLNNSDIYQVCDHIKAKYPNHFFVVTGDASGKNRTGTARGKTSYWYIIRQELQLKDVQIRLRGMNIGLIESRVLCNSALQHKTIVIDPSQTELINDCKYATVDDKGILVKDRKKNANDFLDCFAGWTLVTTDKGNERIDTIEIGRYVRTRNGLRKVIDKWSSYAVIYEYELSNGEIIHCTKDHKFYSYNTGFIEICTIFEERLTLWHISHIEGLSSTSTQNSLTTIVQYIKREIHSHCIDKSGLMLMVQYLTNTIFIIKMAMLKTMILIILKLLVGLITLQSIFKKGLKRIQSILKSWHQQGNNLQGNGTNQMRVEDGIENTQKLVYAKSLLIRQPNASNAGKNTKPKNQQTTSSAQTIVNHQIGERQELTTLQRYASIVKKSLLKISTRNQKLAVNPVQIVSEKKIGRRKVYDITIQNDHEFYANGILAHNCLRYAIDVEWPELIRRPKNLIR